jgi:hypothetical protein
VGGFANLDFFNNIQLPQHTPSTHKRPLRHLDEIGNKVDIAVQSAFHNRSLWEDKKDALYGKMPPLLRGTRCTLRFMSQDRV